MSESAFPRKVVITAMVAWSRDISRTTPGRTGPLTDRSRVGGEETLGADELDLLVPAALETVGRCKLL